VHWKSTDFELILKEALDHTLPEESNMPSTELVMAGGRGQCWERRGGGGGGGGDLCTRINVIGNKDDQTSMGWLRSVGWIKL